MPIPISCLRDYRDKLTTGTVLGLSYIVDDPGYLTRRSLPIQQLTVNRIQDDVVRFQKQDGHQLRYALDQPITYLRFGPAPYDQAENILSAPEADDHDDYASHGTAFTQRRCRCRVPGLAPAHAGYRQALCHPAKHPGVLGCRRRP